MLPGARCAAAVSCTACVAAVGAAAGTGVSGEEACCWRGGGRLLIAVLFRGWIFISVLPAILCNGRDGVSATAPRYQDGLVKLSWICSAYFSSDSTCCGSALAWANIAVPACCRIWLRVRLAVSEAKSAS